MKLFMVVFGNWEVTYRVVRAESLEDVQKIYGGDDITELDPEGDPEVLWEHSDGRDSVVDY